MSMRDDDGRKKSQNEESLNAAIETLNKIAENPSTPKNIRKKISESSK